MLTFSTSRTVAIGEAMIEMASLGDETYRRGFAGDTFNTAFHMAQALGDTSQVGFVTKVGTDGVSDSFVNEMAQDGLDTSGVGREASRIMGLYMISLDGVERSFQYWRNASAARHLADDADWLKAVISDAGLIHLSGITLAILAPSARETLWSALADARGRGARVSFDPNVRPALWTGPEETRETLTAFNSVTDIALPSFDDEQCLWGDQTPFDTVARLRDAGVAEIVVKNGERPVTGYAAGEEILKDTPAASDIRDTSGAGDAFNSGYLAARLTGQAPGEAIGFGQRVSVEVLRHYGARIPKSQVPRIR